VAVPAVPAGVGGLTLHAPSPAGLNHIIALIIQQGRDSFWYGEGDASLQSITTDEYWALDRLVSADVQRHYVAGLPGVDPIEIAQLDLWNPWPTDGYLQLLRASTIQYVLDHPEVLLDGHGHISGPMTLEPRLFEMDGDAGREWLVAAGYSTSQVRDWLLFNEDSSGKPQAVPVAWNSFYVGHQPAGFDAVHDFTGDGRPEIVIVPLDYMGGKSWGFVIVFHMFSSGWQSVGSIYLEPNGFRGEEPSGYALADFNGDRRTDLRVTTVKSFRYGCTYEVVRDFVWNGRELVRVGLDPMPPQTGGCLLDAAYTQNDPASKILAYERAILQLEVEATVPDRLAWARVQLAMAYAGQGRQLEAEATLKVASQATANGGYLDLLRQALADAGPKAWPICQRLYAQALATGYYDPLGTDIDSDRMWGGYPITYGPRPEAVCPLEALTQDLARSALLPASQPPTAALEPLGVSFAVLESMSLDADLELEWVGVPSGAYTPVMVFDQQGAQWSAAVVNTYGRAEVTVAAIWPAGAAQADLLVVSSGEHSELSYQCSDGQVPLSLRRLSHLSEGWRMTISTEQCADPSLTDLTQEEHQTRVVGLLDESVADQLTDTTTEPAWMQLEGYTGDAPADTNLLAFVDVLHADTLTRNRPLGTQRAISDLIAYLPAGDPAAQRVAARLLYLRGLGYELAGDEQGALDAYAALLDQFPDTLWAWLAWARVGPE
jgi:hypothetical protein